MIGVNLSRSRATLLAAALAMTGAAWAQGGPPPGRPPGAGQRQAQVPPGDITRGEYLVTIMGCHDCHTPLKMGPKGQEPEMSRSLSGHPEMLVMPTPPRVKAPWGGTFSETNTAWAGPWGVSYTANLTPDPETGTGRWTVGEFTQAIRTGRHMGRGRQILPPMPWQAIRTATDADLASIFAYLLSIPAIKNQVPQPKPPEAVGRRPPGALWELRSG